ncbi:AI-2E family transporter [Bailinhaonella thermotolerans]|uniref:AI-2E family transporter n=1 Tax=Bailinhaonella thermotolerans TaxID=1070861 RepID=A0A3A4AQR0_9ACTN|nr:AI-2E family transporter [Bailinhaonella thermotolerans]RJL30939.1 AI-2E family transporter [Bailinhaonella thermotolerans]
MTDERRWPLPRALMLLLGLASAFIVLAGLREVSSIAGPVFLALVMTVTVSPLRSWLARRGAPVVVTVGVPMLVVFLVLLALIGAVALAGVQLAGVLPNYTDEFSQLMNDATRWADSLGVRRDQIQKALNTLDPSRLFGLLQGFLSGLTSTLSMFLLIVIVVFTMGLDALSTSRVMDHIARSRPDLVTALSSFARCTRRYLWVSTVFGAINTVLDVTALYILGVPLPLLWGILAFIANYIPNIGFFLALIPPALIGLLDGGVSTMLGVIIAYMLINFVVQSLIMPKFLGDAVGLSTTLTMLSLLVWAYVLGPLGALLAIPLSTLVRALLVDADPNAKWLAPLISADAPDDDPKTGKTGKAGKTAERDASRNSQNPPGNPQSPDRP